MATIKADLFNLKELQNKILQYKKSLEYKAELAVTKLIQMGYDVALSKIQESPLGKTIVLKSAITPEQAGCKAMLLAIGQVVDVPGREPFSLLMAVEFGAGIHYNPKNEGENPKAPEFGFGVGTYPGQKFALNEDGWWFQNEDGEWVHTFGVKATMPMYNAHKVIRDNYTNVFKEVFKIV